MSGIRQRAGSSGSSEKMCIRDRDYYAYSKLISLLNPNAAYYNLLPGNILYMPQYVAASTTVRCV